MVVRRPSRDNSAIKYRLFEGKDGMKFFKKLRTLLAYQSGVEEEIIDPSNSTFNRAVAYKVAVKFLRRISKITGFSDVGKADIAIFIDDVFKIPKEPRAYPESYIELIVRLLWRPSGTTEIARSDRSHVDWFIREGVGISPLRMPPQTASDLDNYYNKKQDARNGGSICISKLPGFVLLVSELYKKPYLIDQRTGKLSLQKLRVELGRVMLFNNAPCETTLRKIVEFNAALINGSQDSNKKVYLARVTVDGLCMIAFGKYFEELQSEDPSHFTISM